MRVLFSQFFIFILVAACSDVDAQAQQKRYGCPEQVFVEGCLQAAKSLDSLERWAAAENGWRFEKFIYPDLRTGGFLFKKDSPFSFRVVQIQFSDTHILTCSFSPTRFMALPRKPHCESEFAAIEAETPVEGERQALDAAHKYKRWRWQYENGPWRVVVTATAHGYAGMPSFGVLRIKSATPYPPK